MAMSRDMKNRKEMAVIATWQCQSEEMKERRVE